MKFRIVTCATIATVIKAVTITFQWELTKRTTVWMRRCCIHFTFDAQLRLGLGGVTCFHRQSSLNVYRRP